MDEHLDFGTDAYIFSDALWPFDEKNRRSNLFCILYELFASVLEMRKGFPKYRCFHDKTSDRSNGTKMGLHRLHFPHPFEYDILDPLA